MGDKPAWRWHCDGNEIRIATRKEYYGYHDYASTSYILPEGASAIYVKMTDASLDFGLVDEYYPSFYSVSKFVNSSGQVAWCQYYDDSRQLWTQFLPFSYQTTLTATSSDGNTYSRAKTKELLIFTPPSTALRRINIGVEYVRYWDPLTMGYVQEGEEVYDYDTGMYYYKQVFHQQDFYYFYNYPIVMGDGDYWAFDCDTPLEYQSFDSDYDVYDEYGNSKEMQGGIYVDGGAYYPEYGRPAIVAIKDYYIKKIYQIPYNYGWPSSSYESDLDRHSVAFIGYDPAGNVVTNSPRQYDSNGNPLPIFGPVTDDETRFWFFAAPIPYNITFLDELGAENPNATTYTVEDCYEFAPPAEVEGWDFIGWDVSGVDHQSGDITVTAQWRQSDRQVTFDVGAHGSRTGGGELSQTVVWGEAAVPPEIEADIDWVFAGWDADISRVTESMTVTALYERPPLPFSKAAGLGGAWTSGGDAEWFTEWTEEAHDGTNHLHSGAIGDGQVSWVETTVSDPGVLSFWWRASSEQYEGDIYDFAFLSVDGEPQGWLDGNYRPQGVAIGGATGWTNEVHAVTGAGTHTLKWTYQKNGNGKTMGEDCAWLDEVTWTPAAESGLPQLATNAAPEAVTNAIASAGFTPSVAAVLQDAICGDAAKYNEFKTWTQVVKNSDGEAAGEAAVVASERAAISYLLGTDTLIANDIESDDVHITGFLIDHGAENDGGEMQFSFEVAIDGVDIGSSGAIALASLKENLRKAIGVEGATRLDGEFSSENIELTVDASVDGKARFTATPPPGAGDSFFIRAKVIP